jgi:thymidylate synthase
LSFNYSSNSLTDIHKVLMMTLHDDYDCLSAPRGKPIKELIGAQFTLMDPRNRLIASPARNVNYGFAVGELCWYLRGDTDLETMLYYNKRMGQFSDDGKTINSAYGYRMFRYRFRENQFSGSGHDAWDRSQLTNVLEELRRDPDSRRAIMHINEPPDLDKAVCKGSKDVPCTLSIQLLIRDRKLHMLVQMRSNDVVWGLPYDVFSFTCLQEAFLYMLQNEGVPVDDLGSYIHTAGSLHVYETHFAMAEEISKEPDLNVFPMRPLKLDQLRDLAEIHEADIRLNGLQEISWLDGEPGEVDWMIQKLLDHRKKREEEAAKRAEKDRALNELSKLTEELGGYDEPKQGE